MVAPVPRSMPKFAPIGQRVFCARCRVEASSGHDEKAVLRRVAGEGLKSQYAIARCRHCERSEAIHGAARKKAGLLRRFAPRNDERMCVRILAACFARGLAGSFGPLQSEGAGNAGRPMRPIAACAEVVAESTRVVRSHRKTPGIPRAMVLTASFALSPVTGLFCHRRPRKLLPANLTPASGRQDHTTSPSASRIARQARGPRPPHPAPRP
jgi:hypothetical protein